MYKKLIAGLLTLAMVLSLVPVTIFAEDNEAADVNASAPAQVETGAPQQSQSNAGETAETTASVPAQTVTVTPEQAETALDNAIEAEQAAKDAARKEAPFTADGKEIREDEKEAIADSKHAKEDAEEAQEVVENTDKQTEDLKETAEAAEAKAEEAADKTEDLKNEVKDLDDKAEAALKDAENASTKAEAEAAADKAEAAVKTAIEKVAELNEQVEVANAAAQDAEAAYKEAQGLYDAAMADLGRLQGCGEDDVTAAREAAEAAKKVADERLAEMEAAKAAAEAVTAECEEAHREALAGLCEAKAGLVAVVTENAPTLAKDTAVCVATGAALAAAKIAVEIAEKIVDCKEGQLEDMKQTVVDLDAAVKAAQEAVDAAKAAADAAKDDADTASEDVKAANAALEAANKALEEAKAAQEGAAALVDTAEKKAAYNNMVTNKDKVAEGIATAEDEKALTEYVMLNSGFESISWNEDGTFTVTDAEGNTRTMKSEQATDEEGKAILKYTELVITEDQPLEALEDNIGSKSGLSASVSIGQCDYNQNVRTNVQALNAGLAQGFTITGSSSRGYRLIAGEGWHRVSCQIKQKDNGSYVVMIQSNSSIFNPQYVEVPISLGVPGSTEEKDTNLTSSSVYDLVDGGVKVISTKEQAVQDAQAVLDEKQAAYDAAEQAYTEKQAAFEKAEAAFNDETADKTEAIKTTIDQVQQLDKELNGTAVDQLVRKGIVTAAEALSPELREAAKNDPEFGQALSDLLDGKETDLDKAYKAIEKATLGTKDPSKREQFWQGVANANEAAQKVTEVMEVVSAIRNGDLNAATLQSVVELFKSDTVSTKTKLTCLLLVEKVAEIVHEKAVETLKADALAAYEELKEAKQEVICAQIQVAKTGWLLMIAQQKEAAAACAVAKAEKLQAAAEEAAAKAAAAEAAYKQMVATYGPNAQNVADAKVAMEKAQLAYNTAKDNLTEAEKERDCAKKDAEKARKIANEFVEGSAKLKPAYSPAEFAKILLENPQLFIDAMKELGAEPSSQNFVRYVYYYCSVEIDLTSTARSEVITRNGFEVVNTMAEEGDMFVQYKDGANVDTFGVCVDGGYIGYDETAKTVTQSTMPSQAGISCAIRLKNAN